MKKNKIGILLSILAIGAISLASCDNKNENAIDSKEFEIKKFDYSEGFTKVDVDKIDEFMNKHDAKDNVVKLYPGSNDFNSCVTLEKKQYVKGNVTEDISIKTVCDFETGEFFQYQKYEKNEDGVKSVSEYETCIVKTSAEYVLLCDLTLNDYVFDVVNHEPSDSSSSIGSLEVKRATGNAKFMMTFEKNTFLENDKEERIDSTYQSVPTRVFSNNTYYLNENKETIAWVAESNYSGFELCVTKPYFLATYYDCGENSSDLKYDYMEVYYSKEKQVSKIFESKDAVKSVISGFASINQNKEVAGYVVAFENLYYSNLEVTPFFNFFFSEQFQLRDLYRSNKEFAKLVENNYTCKVTVIPYR